MKLSAPVVVIRDKWGVPHIYAQNEHDLFFGQGYVHAQDRLWQMEFNRRVGRGTLSAILGEATLDTDRFLRTIGLRRAAEKDWALANDEVQALMEAYADGDWKRKFQQYQDGEITVGRFNEEAFAMVKEGRETLVPLARNGARVRGGFADFYTYCQQQGFRLVIVSNGLDFYIKEVLGGMGLGDIEVFAARTEFHPGGLKVQYVGPEGTVLDAGFKDSYVDSFLGQGYRMVYIGNGASDIPAAVRCHHIFATGDLLAHCGREGIACTPFTDFHRVISGLEVL